MLGTPTPGVITELIQNLPRWIKAKLRLWCVIISGRVLEFVAYAQRANISKGVASHNMRHLRRD